MPCWLFVVLALAAAAAASGRCGDRLQMAILDALRLIPPFDRRYVPAAGKYNGDFGCGRGEARPVRQMRGPGEPRFDAGYNARRSA